MSTLATVYVKDGNIEQAIKKLRKKVAREEILIEYRNRMYFKSKGQERRKKKEAAIRKQYRNRMKQEARDKRFD